MGFPLHVVLDVDPQVLGGADIFDVLVHVAHTQGRSCPSSVRLSASSISVGGTPWTTSPPRW